jgi:peroxiredoxin
MYCMVELGELEGHSKQFAERRVKIVAISNDNLDDARATQADFPHLAIVSDANQNLAKAMDVLEAGAGPKGDDVNAPTTFLVDGTAQVRWLFRPARIIERLPADDLLAAIDRNL